MPSCWSWRATPSPASPIDPTALFPEKGSSPSFSVSCSLPDFSSSTGALCSKKRSSPSISTSGNEREDGPGTQVLNTAVAVEPRCDGNERRRQATRLPPSVSSPNQRAVNREAQLGN